MFVTLGNENTDDSLSCELASLGPDFEMRRILLNQHGQECKEAQVGEMKLRLSGLEIFVIFYTGELSSMRFSHYTSIPSALPPASSPASVRSMSVL